MYCCRRLTSSSSSLVVSPLILVFTLVLLALHVEPSLALSPDSSSAATVAKLLSPVDASSGSDGSSESSGTHQNLLSVRGGDQEYYPPQGDPNQHSAVYRHPSDTIDNPYADNYEDGFYNYNPPPNDAEHIFQESVQERVDRWKTAQMEKYANLTPEEQETGVRDEQGRTKLVNYVSKGSRALIFFMLMWRDVYLFDVADQAFKGGGRIVVRTLLTIMFVGNMAGVLACLSALGHSTKNRLKTILNFDKLVEVALVGWYLLRLTVLPSKYVPREVFVAGMLHSSFFIAEAQAFTRVNWDEKLAPPIPQRKPQQNPAYDDFSDRHETWARPQDSSAIYASNQATHDSYQGYNHPPSSHSGPY